MESAPMEVADCAVGTCADSGSGDRERAVNHAEAAVAAVVVACGVSDSEADGTADEDT